MRGDQTLAGGPATPLLLFMRRPLSSLLCLLLTAALACSGCSILVPHTSTMPVVHNPFPQLSRVAVVPFFNQSDEPTLDGREFALAYFAELQGTAGFEVVPVGVVEAAIVQLGINFSSPDGAASEARRLGKALGVDAVVIGSVTDYSPYYPPRCGMHVEWYATNPGFHEIPAGYGLPWGTPEEEYIPEDVAFDAELALAKAQLATQAPECSEAPLAMPEPPALDEAGELGAAPLPTPTVAAPTEESDPPSEADLFEPQSPTVDEQDAPEALPAPAEPAADAGDVTATSGQIVTTSATAPQPGFPADWPDPQGFTPPGPVASRPQCIENPGPVMTHTKIFRGHDPEFTAALAAYVDFRDDARFGGWRSYLERSDDFIRFCCHLHLSQMLTARGGASETRVVQRWADNR